MDMKDTLGVLLAGGAGERLFPLTRDRAKPAVPFGGHYRIIDITLSNCINSGLRRVYILTQYKALSLNRHIREGWTGIVAQELGEFFELMPPMQRPAPTGIWAPPMRSTRTSIRSAASSRNTSSSSRATTSTRWTTAGCWPTTRRRTRKSRWRHCRFRPTGIAVRRGGGGRQRRGDRDSRRSRPSTSFRSPFNPNAVDASMGVYIFNTEALLKALIADADDTNSKHDFGHNILPNLLGKRQ